MARVRFGARSFSSRDCGGDGGWPARSSTNLCCRVFGTLSNLPRAINQEAMIPTEDRMVMVNRHAVNGILLTFRLGFGVVDFSQVDEDDDINGDARR